MALARVGWLSDRGGTDLLVGTTSKRAFFGDISRERPGSPAWARRARSGAGFILRGLRVDLDCRDEELCTRGENFSYVYDITEQYENLLGDYWGRICRRLKPSEADRADHEQLCHLLDALFKEVRGIKTKAAQALGLLQHSPKETVQPLLRGVLQRILAHRERVLQIEAELKQITWLEPVLSTEKR
jgi:hypothetical protein